ncbi:MAG: WG repeat-containing protein [Mongoliibacter sp.]|uniref:WG repeat-containing protein n=1 Tax=Mongoliibacter sp. TaxID=2022438 RepID=UPI0012F2B9BF|nr:WG repeat-containing protein [Mongoliibacter sp.]TVP44839.1 MAG: WG repeat-containing protein [Mongoliibacter sp.]
MSSKLIWGSIFSACILHFTHLPAISQTYEVYDQNLMLKSRVEYDHIRILGESVRISNANNQVKLLSREYKPFINLKAESIHAYDQPWIITQGKQGKGAFHEYGEEILPAEYDNVQTFFTRLLANKGRQYWLYDHSTRELTDVGTFDEAILAMNGQVIAKTAQGYFLPLSDDPDHLFDEIREINQNYLIAKEATGYGLVNREGNYVLRPVIDHLVHLEEDYFYAYDGNQYMLIKGREGKADISYSSYHKITNEDGMLLEYIHGKLRRVMDNDGILLDQVGMEKVLPVGEKHYNVFLRDQTMGLLGPKGWEVKPIAGVDKILPGKEGLYPALKDGKLGFVDVLGKWAIPAKFEDGKKFNEGFAAVKSNGRWGYIDRNGSWISDTQFEQGAEFKRGLALVRLSGKQNLIDRSGNLLLSEGYERISRGADNYFITEDDNKFGLIAPDGKEIVAPKFQELRREDLNKILVRLGDKYGILDENGDYLLPLYYKSIVFDQGANQILAEDFYQFEPEPTADIKVESNGRKKRGG